MKFGILVNEGPFTHQASDSAYRFAEAALASFVVRSLIGDGVPHSFVGWLTPLGAVLLAEMLSLVAVPLVIMVVDGKFHPNLFADIERLARIARHA